MEWLTKGLLSIPVKSTSIRFIDNPLNFYSTLLDKIGKSKSRILLSTLYLGTGELEKRFVKLLESRKREKSELRVSILLDYFRGTRENECGTSSATLLGKLCEDCQIKLFHHPDMNGAMKGLLPNRLNEIVGLQHMKFFIFDDSIIISGANLSEIYFTNRQDRYMVVEDCPLLADLFCAIFELICSCSLTLNAFGEIDYQGNSDASLHPLTGDTEAVRREVFDKLNKLFAEFQEKVAAHTERNAKFDTFVYPFLQMGPFRINQELELLSKLFANESSADSDITISTGYFNLHEKYAELISKRKWSHLRILFASPQANGFFNASGFAGYIPAIYVQNSFEFLQKCARAEAGDSVILAEYLRPEWSFHAKGIWISDSTHKNCPTQTVADNEDRRPVTATVIGSSNYGYRSVNRDLEAQVLLVTRDDELSRRIDEEKLAIAKYCNKLDVSSFSLQDHIVPIWTSMTKIFDTSPNWHFRLRVRFQFPSPTKKIYEKIIENDPMVPKCRQCLFLYTLN